MYILVVSINVHNPGLLGVSVQLLVGSGEDCDIQKVSQENGLEISACVAIMRAAGSLFWEFAKSGTSNPATISAILLQLGIGKSLAEQFSQVIRAVH